MDIMGISNAPGALAAKMSLGNLGNRHIKKEPDQSLAQMWESQWQEFLKAMESPEPGLEAPDLSETSPPWDDAKTFLDSFEQVARVFQWPKDEWVSRLLPTLSRDTVQAFNRLEDVDREDYEKLKVTILQGDAMNREMSRQHFRHFCYREVEGPRETYGRLEEFCYRWLKPKSHSKEQILELLILEQFVAILPPEIQSWVKENNPENNARVVLLAEDFILKQRLSGTQQHQGFRILEKRAAEPVGVSWEPEGASLEMRIIELSESQTEAAVNLQAAERAPSDAEQGLQLCREIKREGGSDLLDHRSITENEDLNQPPVNSEQAEPQGQSMSDEDPQINDDRETSETLHFPKEEEIHVGEGGHEFILSEREKTPEDTRVFMQVLRSYQSIRAGKRPFQCLECGKDFARKRNLNRHQRIHTGETPFKCPDCGKGFMWDTSLSVHRRRSHAGEKPAVDPHETLYICCECGDSFSGKRDLDVHQKSHAGETGESFNGTGDLVVYQRNHAGETHTGEEPFKIADTGENFTWRSSFERHRKIQTGKKPALLVRKRTHTGEKKYKCTLCGIGFFKLWQLRKHQLIHTGENPYQCSDCGKSFMWSSSLERHRKDHAKEGTTQGMFPLNIPCVGEKNHPCSKCGKSLQTASQLRRHECVQAGERKGNDCGGSFVSGASPNQHKKLNMGNNAAPFLDKALLGERQTQVCSDCGRRFQCLSHLKRHRRLHTGEKPYKCDDCGESFMWSSTLERHRKTHRKRLQKAPSGKEKPHVHSKCKESLQSASDLRRQQHSHTRETRYKCMDCGESFMRSITLENHRKIHSKERHLQKTPSVKEEAHVCSKCGKSLQSASKLRVHQRLHTGERPYKCNDCGESFMWSTSFHRHKKQIHKGKNINAPVNKKLYICSVCGKDLKKSSHLKRHQLIHTGERPYKCNVCGKRFTRNSSLNQHMIWHNKGKKVPPPLPKTPPVKRELHMCSVCGKNFKKASYLKSHQATHSTSMFRCTCGKSFVWESSLQRHKRQHHKQKKAPLVLPEASPFQKGRHICSVCGKGFISPSRLIKHQVIHTKEKPYNCSQCCRSYFHKDSLSRHKKIHTECVKRP